MKSLLYLLVLFAIPTCAEKIKLTYFGHHQDLSKNCNVIGSCVSRKYLKDGELQLFINIDNYGRDLNAYRNQYKMIKDTLVIELSDTIKAKPIRVYNPLTRKMETRMTKQILAQTMPIGAPDYQCLQYNFKGINYIPKYIKFDGSILKDSPTKPFKYKIHEGQMINLVNPNGYRQGLWLSFYHSGKLKERSYYNNGDFIKGTYFEENGDSSQIYQGGCSHERFQFEE